MTKTNEPFWWALFSAGGVVAAFVIPILIFLTGIPGLIGGASSLDGFQYENISGLLSRPLTKLFLFVAVSLPLFHCAHRIRHTLVDVGLKNFKLPLMVVCYAGAFGGTVLCAILLLRI